MKAFPAHKFGIPTHDETQDIRDRKNNFENENEKRGKS